MSTAFSVAIEPVQTTSGNQFRANRIIEEASETFVAGTPVQINSSDGGLQAWDGSTTTLGLAGISYEAASNLGTTGKGAPSPLSPLTGAGTTVTFGSVPNETAAVNIPHGAPINDGRCGLWTSAGDTIFSGAFGNAGAAATPAATDVGKQYGMTKDPVNAYWYVDKSKTSTSAVVQVVGLDLRDTPAAGSRVLFTIMPAAAQLVA